MILSKFVLLISAVYPFIPIALARPGWPQNGSERRFCRQCGIGAADR